MKSLVRFHRFMKLTLALHCFFNIMFSIMIMLGLVYDYDEIMVVVVFNTFTSFLVLSVFIYRKFIN